MALDLNLLKVIPLPVCLSSYPQLLSSTVAAEQRNIHKAIQEERGGKRNNTDESRQAPEAASL
jgi:hypothetical protein